jgi:hypothetical protein
VSDNKYGTMFLETEALLAITEEDFAHAARLIEQMLPGERSRLANAADELASLIRQPVKRTLVQWPEDPS